MIGNQLILFRRIILLQKKNLKTFRKKLLQNLDLDDPPLPQYRLCLTARQEFKKYAGRFFRSLV